MTRRTALKGFVTTAAVGALGGTLTSRFALAAESGPSTLGFQSLEQVITENHAVAPGYSANVLIRWGDPVLAGAPEFDPMNQTADAQAKQFGYNCDYLAYFPLPRGSDNSEHGLLHVNHEYTSAELMFAGWTKLEAGEGIAEDKRGDAISKASLAAQTPEQTRIEMMGHNGSVIEVRKENGTWSVVPDSQYARRITLDTEMRVSGPASGHDRLKTNADPTGTKVFGTINNCAGGKTPWGTVLMAEENFHGYFGGELPAELHRGAEPRALRRPGRLVSLVAQPGPLRHRQGAERTQPLRLDGRVRPLRSQLAAGEAHCARSHEARGRDQLRQQGRPRGALYRRRRALRVPLSLRHQRDLRPEQSRGQSRPARRRHAVGRQVR